MASSILLLHIILCLWPGCFYIANFSSRCETSIRVLEDPFHLQNNEETLIIDNNVNQIWTYFEEGGTLLETFMKRVVIMRPEETLKFLSFNSKKLIRLDDQKSLLNQFLIPRPVGSKNHEKIQQLIKETCQKYDWTLFRDSFSQETLVGNQIFNNLIALNVLNARQYIIFAAHYDSKRLHWNVSVEEESFIGATDSAVSCVLLLDLMRSYSKAASKGIFNDSEGSTSIGIQLIFFDGEESFKEWNETDSLYGSRHLAKLYSQSIIKTNALPLELIHGNVIELPQVTRAFTSSAIKLFVLLDLLGSKQSNTMMNLHSNTTFYYQFLAFLEQLLDHHHPHLDDSFLLNSNETASKKTPFFMNADGFHILVDDDHKPFEMLFPSLKILHLIPVPYPDVWHTIADNKDSLDQQVIYKWQQLLTLFLFYLLTNQE